MFKSEHIPTETPTPARASGAVASFFGPDDCVFLEGIFARFPDIGVAFNTYLIMPAANRPEAAMEDLDRLPRIGPVLRRIPSPETVFDHSKRLGAKARALAEEIYKNPAILKLTEKEKELYKNELPPETADPKERAAHLEKFAAHLEALADAHDLPEALVTDFPPNETQSNPNKHITKVEKKRLEKLAARIIYEGDPTGMACYEEYEAKQTLSAQLLSDLDKIDPCHLALIYETQGDKRTANGDKDNSNFESHVVTAREKLLTAYGRAELDALERNADTIREKARDFMENGFVTSEGKRLRPIGTHAGLVRSEKRSGLGGRD